MMVSAIQSQSSISSAQQILPAEDAASKSTVDYDAFLQLLVKQLKTQDPTDPTDSSEFFSQLASFSSVEQQIQTNTKLEALLTASQLGEATNLIGKTVSYGNGEASGTVTSVHIDTGGKIIAELEDGSLLAINDGIQVSDGNSR